MNLTSEEKTSLTDDERIENITPLPPPENLIRFFKLDRSRLAEIASRIGPDIEEINHGGDVRADLIENFAARGGYLKPAEGEGKLPMVEKLVDEDLARIAVAS